MNSTVNNTFNTAVNNDTFNVVGTVNNTFNMSGVTGNFVNMSFFFDQYSLVTGYDMIEAGIGRNFFMTGYSVGTITSGTSNFFSGSFYQRTPTNIKTNFLNFSLNSGLYYFANGGYDQVISGMNRVGLDILNIGTGFTGVSINLFGVGY